MTMHPTQISPRDINFPSFYSILFANENALSASCPKEFNFATLGIRNGTETNLGVAVLENYTKRMLALFTSKDGLLSPATTTRQLRVSQVSPRCDNPLDNLTPLLHPSGLPAALNSATHVSIRLNVHHAPLDDPPPLPQQGPYPVVPKDSKTV